MIVDVLLTAGAVGLLVPLLLPFVANRFGYGQRLANWYAGLAVRSMSRPTLAFDDDGTLFVRNLQLDAKDGGYGVSVNGWRSVRPISDTVHRLGSRRLTLTDVDKGVTCDPRDLLVGMIEHRRRRDGEMEWTVEAEASGDHEFGRQKEFVRAALQLPSERPSIPLEPRDTLRPIVDGSADSQSAESMYDALRRVFQQRRESLGIVKTGILAGSFLAGFAVYWFTAGPGSISGSGGGTTVGIGQTLVLLGLSGGSDESLFTGRRVAALAAVGVALSLVGLATWTGVVATAVLVGGFAGGALLPFVASEAARYLPDRVNRTAGRVWWRLALYALDDPFIVLTDRGEYRLVPAADVGGDTGERVRLEGQWVGLTCDVSPTAFGDAGVDTETLQDELMLTAGEADANRVAGASERPDRMWPTRIVRDQTRGVVPDIRDAGEIDAPDTTWVRTGRWLSRFADARTGHEALSAHDRGIDDFAEGGAPLTELQLVIAAVVLSAAGLGLGLGITVIL